MQVQTHAWENALLVRAYEARHLGELHDEALYGQCVLAPDLLARAYAHCEAVTAHHSKSFYLASGLLPVEKRRSVRALYAFCRVTDNIVDCLDVDCLDGDYSGDGRATRLDAWRERILSSRPPEGDLVSVAWTHTRRVYGIPMRYAEQLIDGVAQDLVPQRYETFDDLAAYAYGVASTVGLMSMHIVGYSSPDAIRYAIKLGVALQLTNILRDVAEDWRAGRLYLPAEDLARFGVDTEMIAQGRVCAAWRALMRFQIERNRRLYAEAMPGIAYLSGDSRFAIGAAAELYQAILGEIERRQYDVFGGRASVSAWGKVGRLPGIWWRSRLQGGGVGELARA